MDSASRNVVALLEGVQAVRKDLHTVRNHYIRRRLKVSHDPGCGPIWALDGYFDLGIMVTGADGQNYELSARLMWPGAEWAIRSDASLEQEGENGEWTYPTLR